MVIWHSAPIEEVKSDLQTDFDKGLSQQQVDERLTKHGKNQLTEKEKKTFFQRFIAQLKDFMILVLIVAVIVEFIVNIIEQVNGHETNWIEPLIILAIVILNALLGVFQESKAEAALDALKNMSPPSAKVLRDGVVTTIEAFNLVPGDIIVLEAGDLIPADARIISGASLRVEESALTGESVAVEKNSEADIQDIAALGDRVNMVYSGCSVAYGRCKAVVTDTGMGSEMGKIATLIDNSENAVTPLQIKLAQLGKTLGLLALIICFVIFVIGIIDNQSFVDMFLTSVSLAVAAIPEGLPAIVTIVLALGVQRLVKKNAIIRRLPAIETLGSASVICSDKTGTLTQNKMTLVEVYTNGKQYNLSEKEMTEDVKTILRLGAICCDGYIEVRDGKTVSIGDPTETGIVAAAMKYTGMNKTDLESIYPRMNEIPFDSERKLMTTVNMIDGKPFAIVKGAPDILISRCINLDEKAANEVNHKMASSALRVLGIAVKPLTEAPPNALVSELEHDLTFVGLVGMIDPPRPEAKESIELCKRAGIKTVMITGDHVITAMAISRQLGILTSDDQAITGRELSEMDDEQFSKRIESLSVYARVSPQDKIRIVNAWQEKGKVVAMTGDGVNDAPALKAADIGCAMGITGTDVAKSAAAMTLTDDNFSTIVSAVEEGRGIYDNIKKAVHFLLSCNLGEVLTVFVAILLWQVSPLLPIHLLWINLVTDGFPALALGMEPSEHDIMHRKPRDKKESIFSDKLGINAIWQGALFAIITLTAFAIGYNAGGENNLIYAQTMAFATLAFSQLVHSMNVRSSHSLFKAGWFKNKWMIGAFFLSALLMLLVLFTPARTIFSLTKLSGQHWAMVAGLSILPLVVVEIVKLVTAIVNKSLKKN